MSRGVTQQVGTYGSRPDKGEESTYQPLVLLKEGQYQVTPVGSSQHWYMGKRADLRVEFARVSGDNQGEVGRLGGGIFEQPKSMIANGLSELAS